MNNAIRNAASGVIAALALATAAQAAPGKIDGSFITTPEGVQLYFKDWGPKDGPVVTFSHGWPLNSDSFESQMIFLADKGYRVVAHDRRGHGRSSQPWNGNDMDHYADDLATVIETLNLKDITVVGFSTGGGEVARYIGRHGTSRVKKAVLIGAVPPLMLKTADNPGGVPLSVYDGIRKGAIEDRAQAYFDIASGPFFGYNRPGTTESKGRIQAFVSQGLQAGHKNTFDSIKAFSETDFRPDLKKFNVPTLIVHGDDDQLVPVDNNARASHAQIRGSKLIIYKGAPHGITDTHKDQLNNDLLNFLRE